MIGVLVISMCLLSLEKICYIYVYNHPHRFKAICKTWFQRSPIEVLGMLLFLFKLIQMGVFINWWWMTDSLHFPMTNSLSFYIGLGLVIPGQILNLSVFRAIGNTGVLYGKQFGYEVPWVTTFPFSLMKHPQYVGTLMSIWGCFLVMNYTSEYWYAIPVLETILYILGAEQEKNADSAL